MSSLIYYIKTYYSYYILVLLDGVTNSTCFYRLHSAEANFFQMFETQIFIIILGIGIN